MHSLLASSAILASTLFSAVRASGRGLPRTSTGQNLAVYWGQGANQNSLASFCADSTIDIIPIGFVNVFPDQSGTYGYPGTNFGNACGGYYVDAKNETTQLLGSCPQIGADITYCQSQGKKILLSLGGGSTGVFVATDDSAITFGDFLYGAFGPASLTWTGPRPFGNACVDGFDFDIEASASAIPVPQGAHYATMVNHLRTLGPMMITASPQCIVPDANLGDALANAYFDAVFVQFYNTPQCSARAYFDHTYGAYGGPPTDISYDSWISWIQTNSNNPAALVYLGLPAAPGATFGQMYLSTTEAQEILTYFQGKYPAQFGGAMLWEATFSENNQVNGMSYAANIKCFLTGSSCTTSTTSGTPSSTSTVSGGLNPTGSGFPSGGSTIWPNTTTSTSCTTGPTNSVVTATNRNGNTFTYTPTNVQPTGTSFTTPSASITWSDWDPTSTSSSSSSTSSSTSWIPWDPSSSTASPVSSSVSSSTSWPEWDPSTSASPASTSTPSSVSLSTSWPEWDPSTTASAVSTTTSSSVSWSTSWPEWDASTTASPASTSTSSISWQATITAADVVTMTIVPLPASSTSSPSIASWSSFWTVRASLSSSPAGALSTQSASTLAATNATSSSTWSFTGWSAMPSVSTLAPLPAIATVTAGPSVGANSWIAGTGSPSMSAYVQPSQYTGAGSVSRPIFGAAVAFMVGTVLLLL